MTHIGKMIKIQFDKKPRTFTIKWFAEMIHCQRANIYRIFKKQNIDLQLLWNISIALNHNFFKDLSEQFEEETKQ